MKDTLLKIVWHWQLGWLRRPEMDNEHGYCYEEPDGDLVYTSHPWHEKNMRLCVWGDPRGGEKYTTISKAPAPKTRFVR